jgi:predicted PurR-regulated permease PerM
MTIFIGLIAIQFIIGNYSEPVMSGSTLSIAPSVVIFVTVFWTFMWGALGAFLGVPIAIRALTMCEQFPSTRWISAILAEEPK